MFLFVWFNKYRQTILELKCNYIISRFPSLPPPLSCVLFHINHAPSHIYGIFSLVIVTYINTTCSVLLVLPVCNVTSGLTIWY